MSGFEHLLNQKFRAASRRGGAASKLGIELLEPRCMLSVNVTTWHNDLTRQGLNTNETVLTPANVNSSTFGKLFSYAVTGQVYAEPLYASNLNMGALGTHNVVFVATENNDVYAFDAVNNGAGGSQLWHVNLGPAAATPNAYFGNRYNGGQYLDITPQVGITSTPVIDLATNTMYIDAFTNPSTGVYEHHIWALDITTGAQKMAPVAVAASVQGDSVDAVGGIITFDPKQQIQRSAVTLLNGVVYFAYAGYADTDPYHGWILGYDATNLNLVKVFNVTPRAGTDSHEGEGGIWMSGAGLASDGTHLYVITGNGDFDSSVNNFGDTILELTPDNSTQPTNKNGYGLSVVNNTTDSFTPFNEQTLSMNDTDLGSGGALVLPDQAGAHPHELVGAGKGGVIYLVDRDNFGGYNSTTDNVVGKATMAHATSSPAYFNNTIYYHAFGDVLKAFKVANGTITPAAIATGAFNYAFPGATPAVSSYGDSANGIVLEIAYSTTNATLRAYNAVPNGSTLTTLYSSTSGSIGAGVKFTVPTVADGRVYVGGSGSLTVFGLLSNASTAPTAPTGLSATASSVPAMQIQLGWTDVANNENAFKIERSDNGGVFVQIAVASVNATTYTDINIVSGHSYTYRVRATNPIGDSDYSNTATASFVATPPVYRYGFDDGSGTFASDSAGTNTGVLVGATKPQWVTGRLGANALSFSGDGVYNQTNQSAVQVSSNLVSPLGATSTFSGWVKTTQTGSNNHQQAPALTGVDQLGTASDINWGTLNASGQIGIYVGDSGGIYSTMPINDGQWHNVTMTRDATSGQVQLYIDGTLNAGGSFDIGYKAAQFYLIGALTVRNSSGNVVGANYFNGQIDGVQIYNRVLSSGEISALGQAPSAPAGLSASTVADTGSMLQLAWTNTSNTAQNVQVERKAGNDGAYETIATVPATESTYIDTKLESGTQYFYRIQATGSAGGSEYSNETSAVPPHTQVVGRFIFYNGSKWINEKATSSYIDALALATDKQALLPGQTATSQNYTSYSKGINGIMIDVTNFDGSITPDDFSILVGNSNDIGTWQPGPEPAYVIEFPGSGVGGSIRFELIWDSNAIQNEWVQVTLKANENTGLAEDDVFYFGNAIGETGDSPTNAVVDVADESAAANNHTSSAALTNPYDFNRDKVVDAIDEQIAHDNYSGAAPLQLITVPGTPHGAGAGAALEVGPSKSTDVSAPGVGTEAMSVEATVESPANQPLATHTLKSFAPFEVITLSNSQAAIQNRAKAVDAVFDGFARSFNHDDSAARLLNLKLNRNARVAGASHSNGQNDLQATSAELCGNGDAADESLTSDFQQFRYGPALKSVVKR